MASRMLLLFGIPVGMLATWSLVSPYFIEKRSRVAAPVTLNQAAQPSSESGSLVARSGIAENPDSHLGEPMPPMGRSKMISRGDFSGADADHQSTGAATIYRAPDGRQLLRLENFQVTSGPDLVVYLTHHPMPANAGDVTSGFTKLGPLKANAGNQNYDIPLDIDTAEYGAVVIWCERFGVLFAAAPLGPPGT